MSPTVNQATLQMRLNQLSSIQAAGGFEITATADGTDHAVTVAAATTGAYAAGSYQWIAWVESGAEKYTVDEGTLEVEPDYRSGTATAAKVTGSADRTT